MWRDLQLVAAILHFGNLEFTVDRYEDRPGGRTLLSVKESTTDADINDDEEPIVEREPMHCRGV
jgi:hypothetical protein